MGDIRSRPHFQNAIWDCAYNGGNHTRDRKHYSGDITKFDPPNQVNISREEKAL